LGLTPRSRAVLTIREQWHNKMMWSLPFTSILSSYLAFPPS
jgi:hypothetical protein